LGAANSIVTPGIDIFPWPTAGAGYGSFGFAVPDDFASFVSATVVIIPKGNVTGTYDMYASVKRSGEVAGTGVLFNFSIPVDLSEGVVEDIDITGLLVDQFDADSAGNDYVSVFFWFPDSPGLEDATVLGMRFVYNEILVSTVDLDDGSVTHAKLASNSVNSLNVMDGTLTAADLGNDSVGSSEIATGAVGSNEIAENSVASNDIKDNTITSNDIVNNAVTSDDIQNGGVSLVDLNPAAVAAAGNVAIYGNTSNDSPSTLDTFQVTAPGEGTMTIIVMGSAFLDCDSTSTSSRHCRARLGICEGQDSDNSCGISWRVYDFEDPDNASSINEEHFITVASTFSVQGGTKTYYLNGQSYQSGMMWRISGYAMAIFTPSSLPVLP
jgi:hypothetical protein